MNTAVPICLNVFQQLKDHVINKIEISDKDNEQKLHISKNITKCLETIIHFFDDKKNTKGIIILPKSNNKEIIPSLLPYILGSTTVLYIGSSLNSIKKFRNNIIAQKGGKPNVYIRTNVIKQSEQHSFLPSIYTSTEKTICDFPKGNLIYTIHVKNDIRKGDSFIVKDGDLNLDIIEQIIKEFKIDLIILDNAYSYSTNIWNLFASNLIDSKCVFLSNTFRPGEKRVTIDKNPTKKRKTIGEGPSKSKLPLKVIGIFQE